jgi:hypothetical protein
MENVGASHSLYWQQWIPNSGKALPSKVLFIGGGKVRDAMMPQRLGQTQVDDAAEGKTGLCCLRPDFFHYIGRLNERPCPVLAIGLANGRRLRRGQWAREYLLISELQIQLHQHQFTHRNILPQGEREQKLLRGFMPRRGSIRGVNGNICVKAGHQQGWLLVAQSRPFILWRERLSHVEAGWQSPIFRASPARRVVADDLLQSPPNHFSETHFIFRSQPFGFAEKHIGDLHLCFYHDGNLPSHFTVRQRDS